MTSLAETHLEPADIESAVAEVVKAIAAEKADILAAAPDEKRDVPDAEDFGIAVVLRDGTVIVGGTTRTAFPIQSISKAFALEIALETCGDRVFERVGREPSGDPFNSIIDMERHEGVPRNPFINAGALVIVDMLVGAAGSDGDVEPVNDFVRRRLGGDVFELNEDVLESELTAGDLNRALMSLAKHFDNFHQPIDRVMRTYVRQCAIALDCVQLAKVGQFLVLEDSQDGSPRSDEAARRAQRIMALMMTCGQYDGSGDFAYRVGLPAKSGVGGGILAIVPGIASIATWSPVLDGNGNSLLGTRALELLTDKVEWSVFGTA